MTTNNTGNSVQALWITNMKSKIQLTSLLASGTQIKEEQWQGTIFEYPAVRFSIDFMPGINGCLDEAEIEITVYSAQKSSDEASTIAGVIQQLYHRLPFKQGGVQFPTIIVKKVHKPMRSIYAWESKVDVRIQIA